MRRIVLFAVGSPLAIDAEESCRRAGIEIAAGVRNVAGPVFVSSAVRVLGIDEVDDTLRGCEALFALFTPAHRKAAREHALRCGFAKAATLVDPTSAVARSAELGEGTFVNAGCVIGGAGRIGSMVLVNRGANLGHHAAIGDYASVGPGAILAGSVRVGRGAVIGAGAVLLPEITIGDNAVVAAGSVVRRTVPAGRLAAGNPCRIVKAVPGYGGYSV